MHSCDDRNDDNDTTKKRTFTRSLVIMPMVMIHKHDRFTSKIGNNSPKASNSGISTNLIKPICAEGFVTLSRSMNGATGKPSIFSTSLYKRNRIRISKGFH